MKNLICTFILALFISIVPAFAQSPGAASGNGVIERFNADASEQMPFSPKYSFAYKEGAGDKAFTWIVLTDREPPVKDFMAAADPAEARRVWCEKEKASFVALKLDSKWAVDLYFLCPGTGNVNTEMLSSWNGLESVIVSFDVKSDTLLAGTLKGGEGSCPDDSGNTKYCTQKSDYMFSAPIFKRG